ncbi:MAG: DNA topoisomerase I [Candidatus Aenigmatarchaeota archaeon]
MAHTLVIAEKPSAAKKIAEAIGKAKAERIGKVTYWRIKGKKEIVVVPAVGHLFTLVETGNQWTYPVFDLKWRPIFEAEKGAAWTKQYFNVIKQLAKDADEFVAATDFDIEGSVIAFNILRFLCQANDAKRMKFSTLTKEELNNAFKRPMPHLDWPQIWAGLTRHEMDFYWGINLSRALSLSVKAAGGYKTLSIGRVQGPTLNILEKREREIANFVSKPYWQIFLIADGIKAMHTGGNITSKTKADEIFKKCKGKQAIVSKIKEKKVSVAQPCPFNLTDLQREAYAIFGFSPKMTLDIAQALYEQALISYPRTSSQKLPDKIGYKGIIENISKIPEYKKDALDLLTKRLKPREGPKTDPAHPAIYPTGLIPHTLTTQQKKLYDLIVRRFLSTFTDPATALSTDIEIKIDDETFKAKGYKIVEKGWLDVYKYTKIKEIELPKLREGQIITAKIEIVEKQTQPPPRYTQASILKEMESLSLGTKGTRALILQTLYDRGYVAEGSIYVTELGKAIVSALEKYCPDILSVDLTRHFESAMEHIQEGKESPEKILKEAKDKLEEILKDIKKREKEIGLVIIDAIKKLARTQAYVGQCDCGGEMVIRKSKNGKRFVACTKWPACNKTFNLPAQGMLTVTKEKCNCGLFIIRIKQKGKRAWKLCVRCGFKI